MNLYIRFFDNEALVHNADEALDFLASIPEIPIDKKLEDEIRSYADSDVSFPKRCKVRPHVYFIIITRPLRVLMRNGTVGMRVP